MKARLNGTKDPFVEITEVSLANKPYVVYDANRLEFEQEPNQLNPEEEKLRHLETIRQQAAITAMQGLLSAPLIEGVNPNPSVEELTDLAVKLADALVEKLKGE